MTIIDPTTTTMSPLNPRNSLMTRRRIVLASGASVEGEDHVVLEAAQAEIFRLRDLMAAPVTDAEVERACVAVHATGDLGILNWSELCEQEPEGAAGYRYQTRIALTAGKVTP